MEFYKSPICEVISYGRIKDRIFNKRERKLDFLVFFMYFCQAFQAISFEKQSFSANLICKSLRAKFRPIKKKGI